MTRNFHPLVWPSIHLHQTSSTRSRVSWEQVCWEGKSFRRFARVPCPLCVEFDDGGRSNNLDTGSAIYALPRELSTWIIRVFFPLCSHPTVTVLGKWRISMKKDSLSGFFYMLYYGQSHIPHTDRCAGFFLCSWVDQEFRKFLAAVAVSIQVLPCWYFQARFYLKPIINIWLHSKREFNYAVW